MVLSPSMKCPLCHGTGKCSECAGAQSIVLANGAMKLCPKCGKRRTASRRGKCLRCWGHGWIAAPQEAA